MGKRLLKIDNKIISEITEISFFLACQNPGWCVLSWRWTIRLRGSFHVKNWWAEWAQIDFIICLYRLLLMWTHQGRRRDMEECFSSTPTEAGKKNHIHCRSHLFPSFFFVFTSLDKVRWEKKNVIESNVLSSSAGPLWVKPPLSSQPRRNSGDKLPPWVIDASWASLSSLLLVRSRAQKMPALSTKWHTH